MKRLFEKFAARATRFVGSAESIIAHTILFIGCFVLIAVGINANTVLLVLTTVVSLEAIYLSIFIQMSVNRSDRRLRVVSRDIDEIQEDIDEIQKDVDEIQEDVEGIEKDIDEIQEDVEGIEKDIDEIQEDVEEIEKDEDEEISDQDKALAEIKIILADLMKKLEQK